MSSTTSRIIIRLIHLILLLSMPSGDTFGILERWLRTLLKINRQVTFQHSRRLWKDGEIIWSMDALPLLRWLPLDLDWKEKLSLKKWKEGLINLHQLAAILLAIRSVLSSPDSIMTSTSFLSTENRDILVYSAGLEPEKKSKYQCLKAISFSKLESNSSTWLEATLPVDSMRSSIQSRSSRKRMRQ